MARDSFSEAEQKQIMQAIKSAEKQTSGEIKVHIENHCKEEVLDRAAYLFEELEMHKTDARNGVLFYLAMKDHKFAILGDVGINQKVPEGFWDEVKNLMAKHFKQGDFVAGLSKAAEMAGKKLEEHFPYQKGDVNELSDEISFGDGK
ncbi:MAG: TPM domain-containing protein [Vicingaceae bacterium]